MSFAALLTDTAHVYARSAGQDHWHRVTREPVACRVVQLSPGDVEFAEAGSAGIDRCGAASPSERRFTTGSLCPIGVKLEKRSGDVGADRGSLRGRAPGRRLGLDSANACWGGRSAPSAPPSAGGAAHTSRAEGPGWARERNRPER